MTIKFRHICGKKISCPDNLAGRSIRCPKCGEAVRVPKELGDHTAKQRELEPLAPESTDAAAPDSQACELRPGGQAAVISTTLGEVRRGAADGSIAGEDLVRTAGASDWMCVRDHPELAAAFIDAPSRVGGIRFSVSDVAAADAPAAGAEGEPPKADEAKAAPLGKDVCSCHASRKAEYFCSQCERAMCPECMNKVQGRILCEDCTDKLISDIESRSPEPDEVRVGWDDSRATDAELADETRRTRADRIRTANRVVITELLLACFLSWLGIGWLCCGRPVRGLLLLAGNFCLVTAELCVVLMGPFRSPPLSICLMVGIPFLLVQNALVGTISAVALRTACLKAVRGE